MFRLVGTSVFLGVVLAALAGAALAATVPTDEAAFQAARVQTTTARAPLDAAVISWAQGEPSQTSMQRADQPTVLATQVGTDVSWTKIVLGGLIGAALVIGIVALAIRFIGTPRGHPPLAHH